MYILISNIFYVETYNAFHFFFKNITEMKLRYMLHGEIIKDENRIINFEYYNTLSSNNEAM